jgi:hypothetical protein
MTESEWLACAEPELMLEAVERTATREQLVEFVRICWSRVGAHLPVRGGPTAADEFAALAPRQSDHDAAVYAAEAALKAAGWSPDRHAEKSHQAAILRRLVARPV